MGISFGEGFYFVWCFGEGLIWLGWQDNEWAGCVYVCGVCQDDAGEGVEGDNSVYC